MKLPNLWNLRTLLKNFTYIRASSPIPVILNNCIAYDDGFGAVDLFPSAVGHALLEATENINRLFENLAPLRPFARVKEKDDHYQLQYQVPGLRKEDLKITVHDGVLSIVGEHKEEEGEESDEEYSSAMSFGYYNASIVLPDDAKPDDIKAELKDGVLTIVVPKDEKWAKDVKEVKIY